MSFWETPEGFHDPEKMRTQWSRGEDWPELTVVAVSLPGRC